MQRTMHTINCRLNASIGLLYINDYPANSARCHVVSQCYSYS